ncbi:hypothetical protein [Streptomyces candidus]|uniref:Uncharacterized protein n=1 Tax=Streptomyces candidus TaxID=67283 RepID=A0A7X0HCN1_9ACTN|nr:hypothetical protein [Streptomyces candidus]MBB6435056.1 hypothetical protein [Streptomyces candidus]GHH40921.1 hypothetical protein GCM10018773_23110 [Streptomyces candidus]
MSREGADLPRAVLRTLGLFTPLFSCALLAQVLVRVDWSPWVKGWAYAGLAVLVGALTWLRWKRHGPPVGLDEVRARYETWDAPSGERRDRVRLVVPVREASGRLPYVMLPAGHYLACTSHTVTAFSYDAKKAACTARLWTADCAHVSYRDGRLVVSDAAGRERHRLVVAPGLGGDVDYWHRT